MELKIKIKKTPNKLSDLKGALNRFKTALDQIKAVLVDKDTEVDALALCLLTREHLLLDGLHGTAKSRLADELFLRVEGAKVFSIQLMKGTQIDELFGPLNSVKYREKAEWERNVTNMLPDVHFAFLDEVYRASDMLLPSMMKVLNERMYVNGLNLVHCPLVTAVATCNFVTENPELDAIHDRWMCQVKVKPLDKSAQRIRMLGLEYARRRQMEEVVEPAKFSLADLQKLQYAVNRIEVPMMGLQMFEEIVQDFRRRMNNVYISDRRLCKALVFAMANFLLAAPDAVIQREEMTMDSLIASQFGIIKMNEGAHIAAFTEAYEQVVGAWEIQRREEEEITTLEAATESLVGQFDPKMSLKEARELRDNVETVLGGINNMPSERKPQQMKNQNRLQQTVSSLQSLAGSLNAMKGI